MPWVENILAMFDLINSLPPTSVRTECAFNQMKLMKTDRRHKLSNRHLNDCMLIRLQSQSIKEFNPEAAIEKWMIAPSGQRRRGCRKVESGEIEKTVENDGEIETVTVESENKETANGEIESETETVENGEIANEEIERETLTVENKTIVEPEQSNYVQVISTKNFPDSSSEYDSDYESDFEFEQNESVNDYLVSKYSCEE